MYCNFHEWWPSISSFQHTEDGRCSHFCSRMFEFLANWLPRQHPFAACGLVLYVASILVSAGLLFEIDLGCSLRPNLVDGFRRKNKPIVRFCSHSWWLVYWFVVSLEFEHIEKDMWYSHTRRLYTLLVSPTGTSDTLSIITTRTQFLYCALVSPSSKIGCPLKSPASTLIRALRTYAQCVFEVPYWEDSNLGETPYQHWMWRLVFSRSLKYQGLCSVGFDLEMSTMRIERHVAWGYGCEMFVGGAG